MVLRLSQVLSLTYLGMLNHELSPAEHVKCTKKIWDFPDEGGVGVQVALSSSHCHCLLLSLAPTCHSSLYPACHFSLLLALVVILHCHCSLPPNCCCCCQCCHPHCWHWCCPLSRVLGWCLCCSVSHPVSRGLQQGLGLSLLFH